MKEDILEQKAARPRTTVSHSFGREREQTGHASEARERLASDTTSQEGRVEAEIPVREASRQRS